VSDIPGVVSESAIEDIARLLDEQDMAGGGSRWDDADPPGWQSQDALRAAYRHMAVEVLAAAVPHIERAIRDRVADEIKLAADKQPRPVMALGMHSAARVARGGEATE
jgi:hypothetical protein